MSRLAERMLAVGIDLDGTLIDSVPDLALAANLMLESLDLAPLPETGIAAMVGDGIDPLVERVLALALAAAPAPAALAEAKRRFRSFYAQHPFDRSRVYPGVREGLQRFREAGWSIACVTNKARAFATPVLEGAGLDTFFAALCCAERPEERKPRPDLLIAACARFAVAPGRLLYIGDSGTDVRTARAAGCPVVAVDYGYNHGRPVADEHPDWIVSRLDAVPDLPAERRGDRGADESPSTGP